MTDVWSCESCKTVTSSSAARDLICWISICFYESFLFLDSTNLSLISLGDVTAAKMALLFWKSFSKWCLMASSIAPASPMVMEERSAPWIVTTFLVTVSSIGKRVPRNSCLYLAKCPVHLKDVLKLWHTLFKIKLVFTETLQLQLGTKFILTFLMNCQ